MSHVIKEVAGLLGFTLKHATKKHALTIELLQQSHPSINNTLKIETGKRRSLWHKSVSFVVFNYRTSYHTNIGCEPSRDFHGRIPYKIMDSKFGVRPQQPHIPLSQNAQNVFDQTEMIYREVRKNAMQTCINYKAYYDKKPKLQNSKK